MRSENLPLASFQFYSAERRIFAKREPLTPSQWAEKYRIVPIGAHKGPWRNYISPHLVKIMDTWALPHVREIIICKSPQTGGTEAIYNCAAYVIDRSPATMMFIMPSEATARKVNADRIIPMIRESSRLRELLSPNPDDTTKTRIKLQNGALIYMAHSNSANALAAFPIKYLFFDETDKYPPFVGKETDPITLGEKRARTFRHSYKIFKVSTPTREDGHIWKAYQKADVQYKYYACCPKCEKDHIMTIDNLRYPEDKTAEDIMRESLATYQCPHCQSHWTDTDKERAVRLGSWKREKGKGILRPRSVAFHLHAWVSPDISLSEIAKSYIGAKTNRAKLIDFHNDYLAEPYVEAIGGDVVAAEAVYNRRYQYWPDGAQWRVPMKALVLTCAVDVQTSPPRLECEVVAWGDGYESWGIEYRVIPGDPAKDEVWKDLDEYLQRQWLHESGVPLNISATGVDTGGHFVRQVYAYCRKRRSVHALKGSNMRGKPLITASAVRTTLRNRVQLWMVGTEIAKDMIFIWLQKEDHAHGYMHYHAGYDYQYFRMLTNEVGITEYDKGGRPYRAWKKKSSDAKTEALDIRVYSLAALEILNPNFPKLAKDMQAHIKLLHSENESTQQEKAHITDFPHAPYPHTTSRPRSSGWVRKWR